ncbi:MAG: DNA repair protein RecN [Burkholderiaceae bacterium]
MLTSLYLRDFVIVSRGEIDFTSGFCALSGETGAGKSILLDALGLALGNRSDAAMVREGARQTEIVAAFMPSTDVLEWLREHELAIGELADEREAASEPDTPELQLRRIITADGRSKAFINGSPVTVAQLRVLGEQLIEIHGQHASQSLLKSDGQRQLLDDYGQSGELAAQLRQDWTLWRDTRRLLETAQSRQEEIQAEREQLSWQLEDIDALEPAENEWASLSNEQMRLANAAGLIEATQAAYSALTEDDASLRNRLGHLVSQLRQQARHDSTLTNIISMLESAEIQINEAASELNAYAQSVDLDPARLAQVESRVSDMFQLARKLRCEPEGLEEKALVLRERLAELDRTQDLAALEARVQVLADTFLKTATSLSGARKATAKKLAAAVQAQLGGLGMPKAKFEISLEASEPGPNGIDKIEFLLASHQSMSPKSLSKVASGGELSRVSLAIAVSAAQANPVNTLIFDEADAGVGGAVADAIGQMMRELGRSRQVLAVTHLPQVAACAHRHFQIAKRDDAGGLNSEVTLLNDGARIEEIARMLGGARVTKTTREHAEELITLGAPVNASPKPKRKSAPKGNATVKPKAATPKTIAKSNSSAKSKPAVKAKTGSKPAPPAKRKSVGKGSKARK